MEQESFENNTIAELLLMCDKEVIEV
ncbi:MAG: hypothetical protein ACLSUK_27085 [Hungatella sp.]